MIQGEFLSWREAKHAAWLCREMKASLKLKSFLEIKSDYHTLAHWLLVFCGGQADTHVQYKCDPGTFIDSQDG